MARENSIYVRLRADATEFVTTMRQANQSLRTVDKSFKDYGSTVDEQRARTNAMRDSFRELSTTFLVSGAAITGALGLLGAKFSQFDKAMSVFDAHVGASAAELDALGDIAMEAGHKYGISALEGVEAATALAKAGVGVGDVLGGGLEGALTLAASGNMNVADSAEVAAIAMTQFGLAGKDIPHIADLLAAGAGKAVGEVSDLAWALRQTGLVANMAGWSIEETTGVLSAFAMAGLVGSDAGTSLKSMLLALQSPSGVAQKKMEELGLSFYDTNGEMLSASEIAQHLNERLGGLSKQQRDLALSTIFGQDAIRSATQLYQLGAEGVEEWIDRVDDSGFAAEIAAARMDNLQGDISKLVVSLENAVFTNGSGFNEFLRNIVQLADQGAQALGALPEGVFNTGIAIAGIAAAGALGVGGLMKLVVGIADTKDALRTLGVNMDRAGRRMDPLSRKMSGLEMASGTLGYGIDATADRLSKLERTIGLVAIALGVMEVASQVAGTGLDDIGNSTRFKNLIKMLPEDAGTAAAGIESLATATGNGNTSLRGLGDALRTVNFSAPVKALDWVGSLGGIFDSELGLAKKALGEYDSALASLVNSGNQEAAAEGFRYAVEEGRKHKLSNEEIIDSFGDYEDAVISYAETLGVEGMTNTEIFLAMLGEMPPVLANAAGGAEAAAEGIAAMQGPAEDTAKALDDVLTALSTLGVIRVGSREALSAYQESLDEVDATARDIAKTYQEEADLRAEGKTVEAPIGAVLNETATDFNRLDPAGRTAEGAILRVNDAGRAMVEQLAAQDASFESVRGNLQLWHDDLIANLEVFGITGQAAEDLATHIMGVPDDVSIGAWMDDYAARVAETTGEKVEGIDENVNVDIAADGTEAVVELDRVNRHIGELVEPEEVTVTVTDQGSIRTVQVGIDELTGRPVIAEVTDDNTVSDVQYRVDEIDGKTVYTPISDNGTILTTQEAVNGMYGKTLRTIVTDDGTVKLTQSEVEEMSGRIIETKVTDDGTIIAVQDGIDGVSGKTEFILISEDGTAKVVQEHIDNVQGKTVYIDVISRYGSLGEFTKPQDEDTGRHSVLAMPPRAHGGRAPGVRLPTTGPGTHRTDGFLGVSGDTGMPIVRVDAGEWITNADMSDKYDGLLRLVNRDDPRIRHLAGLAGGGRALQHAAPGTTYTAATTTAQVAPTQIHMDIDYPRLASELAKVKIGVSVGEREFYSAVQQVTRAAHRP